MGHGNIFASVCHSVQGGMHAHTPPSRRILRDAVNVRAVRILLECILVECSFRDSLFLGIIKLLMAAKFISESDIVN